MSQAQGDLDTWKVGYWWLGVSCEAPFIKACGSLRGFGLHSSPHRTHGNGKEGGLVLGGHSGLGRLPACVFGSMGPFALLGQGGSRLGLPWNLLDLTGPAAL